MKSRGKLEAFALLLLALGLDACRKSASREEGSLPPAPKPDSVSTAATLGTDPGSTSEPGPDLDTTSPDWLRTDSAPEAARRILGEVSRWRKVWMDSMGPGRVAVSGFELLPGSDPGATLDSNRVESWTRMAGLGCEGDTLHDAFFTNGDARLGANEVNDFLLADTFTVQVRRSNHREVRLRSGMTQAEVIGSMGTPYRKSSEILSYAVEDWGEKEYSQRLAYREVVRLFFFQGKLKAAWVICPFYDC